MRLNSTTAWSTKPISSKETTSIPEAQAAERRECVKLMKLPAWDLQKATTKLEAVRQAKKEGRSVHFASHGPLTSGACETCQAPPKIQRTGSGRGRWRGGRGTTLQTTMDTELCGQNTAHQLLRWRRQHFWIQSPDFQLGQERQTTRSQRAHKCACLMFQDCCDYLRKNAHKYG